MQAGGKRRWPTRLGSNPRLWPAPKATVDISNVQRVKKSNTHYRSSRGSDGRLYLTVQILGRPLKGLLDSGASRSILGSSGWLLVQKLGFKLQPTDIKVQVANGASCRVEGIVDLPFTLMDRSVVIPVMVVPTVQSGLILGIDFWTDIKLVPDACKGTWSFSEETELTVDSIKVLRPRENLTAEQERRLNLLLDKNLHREPFDTATPLIEHRIDTGQAEPVKQRYYPVSPVVQQEIHKELDNMLRDDVVEPSSSPWSSPILLVKKPSGGYRFVVDYRKVNQVSKKDAYPIPYVSSILDRLRECRYLSSLDIKNAFWQIGMEDSSREKTAFTVPGRGLFQFKRMPFGLHNSAATWQRLIDRVLGPDLEPYVFVYLDDIIVATSSFQQHLVVLEEIFRRLRAASLHLNIEKCHFVRSELKYLGYVIDNSGLHVDPEKVQAIVNFPRPTKVKGVRQFLGMASWYRRFIKDFAALVAPLNALLKKNVKWTWSAEAEQSFCSLKQCLVCAPVLSCPHFDKPFILQTDASEHGIGCVLSQDLDDGEHVIAYGSRSLSRTERNYSVTEKECLAVLWAVERYRPYLEGSQFKVITDHHSLLWLHNLRDPIGRLARWAVRLQQYDFTVQHRKGSAHVVPDALSRAVENLDLLEVMTPIQDQWYLGMGDRIRTDPQAFPNWRMEGSRLFKLCVDRHKIPHDENNWKLVLPQEMRQEAIIESHDELAAGHRGIFKTLAKVSMLYYWPRMKRDVCRYVSGCHTCAQHKIQQRRPAGLLAPRQFPHQPGEVLTVDLIGPLPPSLKQNRYILVVQDCHTKWVYLFPLRHETSQAVLHPLINTVFLESGAPRLLIMDNGRQLASREFREAMAAYGVDIQFTPFYHPQANPVERMNKEVGNLLSIFVGENQRNWDGLLPQIQYVLRTSKHETTKYTPAYLQLGRELGLSGKRNRVLRSNDGQVVERGIEERWAALDNIRERVQIYVQEAQQRQEQNYNLRHRPIQYQVGESVWRRNFVLSDASRHFTAKLAPKYIGPYLITRQVSPVIMELEDQNGREAGRWHVVDLKKVVDR